MLLHPKASPVCGHAGRPRNQDTIIVQGKQIRQVLGCIVVDGSRQGRLSNIDS